MKYFATFGEGPDREWRSEEERARGERQLRADFARELGRALSGRRARHTAIREMLASDEGLWNAFRRIWWEYAASMSDHQINRTLHMIEGGEFRFNRRWSRELKAMCWGFDPEG